MMKYKIVSSGSSTSAAVAENTMHGIFSSSQPSKEKGWTGPPLKETLFYGKAFLRDSAILI